MQLKKIKWLMYTLIIGLIPFMIRVLVWLILENTSSFELISIGDIVSLGFLLHISVLNELEHSPADQIWKTVQGSVSILFLIIYTVLFLIFILPLQSGYINMELMKCCTIILGLVSIGLTSSVQFNNQLYAGDACHAQ